LEANPINLTNEVIMASMLSNLRQIRPLAACVPFMGIFDSNFRISNGFTPNLLALRGFNPERFLANFAFDPVPGLRERKMEIEAPKPFPQQKTSETSRLSGQDPRNWLSHLASTMTFLIEQVPILSRVREIQCVPHVTFDDHQPNEQLTISLESLGLEADAENPGWYKLPNETTSSIFSIVKKTLFGLFSLSNETNPFRVKVVNGQLLWKSIDKINIEHMTEITNFYANKQELQTRGIHINTGTHGDENGTLLSKNSSQFIWQDIVLAQHAKNLISVGIVTKLQPPINHTDKPDLDIIDAWCWSIRTQDPEAIEQHSISRSDILSSYS
jgi:hypothetical protein